MKPDPKQETDVRTLLAAGYGVEDIAVMLDTHADFVRIEIQALRESNELSEVYSA